jgi:hypothetical protein
VRAGVAGFGRDSIDRQAQARRSNSGTVVSACGKYVCRMRNVIHRLTRERLRTYSERAGATAAMLVMVGFGLVAIGESVWRIMTAVLSD